ncbi:MAG: alpha/beta hydrolase [Deltaproteobacteria bacterium]|nr:alpha/beta hydrolase [Deltaproteobacteria bacterium]
MENRFEAGLAFNAGAWPLDPDQSTLVFIHGSGGSKVLWDRQLQSLGGRTNLLALDLPGHGGSPGDGYSEVPLYTRVVADFLKQLKVPGPIPAGLSLGGAITLQLLLDYPENYSTGVLICTGAKLRVMPQILETIDQDYPAFVASIRQFGASPQTNPALLQPILDDSLQCPAAVAYGDFLACDRFDVRKRLPEIKARVLVVSGADDLLTPPKYGQYLAEHIPGARWVEIPEAGHLLPVEKPAELNQALSAFLDKKSLAPST